jgi:2Fe-2S ferredoxin
MRLTVIDRAGVESLIECAPGQSLMSALKQHGYPVQAICGGAMACATCHVFIGLEWCSQLPPRSEFEEALLEDTDHFRPEVSRLSCQIPLTDALSGLSLTIAPED